MTSGRMCTACRSGAISNSTETSRNCSMARAPPTLPQPTNEIGLRRHSTNVQSMAFFSTAG